MLKRKSNICMLIVLLLLCSQALAIETTPVPWRVYRTLESSAEQIEILVDCTCYKDVHLCVINVDEGGLLPELAEKTTLFWDGDERTAVIAWDTRRTELVFCYRPSFQKQGGSSVVGELLFSYYNANGERINQDRVRVVSTNMGLRLSIIPVEGRHGPPSGLTTIMSSISTDRTLSPSTMPFTR